ncbi:hypothetical protein RHSIM_Rhsim02G0183300 [Rhododendron simsii]|uniref:CCHC-type domain-containing protein n=1 Tax=Rhododendron simsii TaxID=118357 RepID=A0A834LZB0_RHOSS|nr:hypothetical protein RHSIM_Rhsim02G0183300 [Rhododendron simsii]
MVAVEILDLEEGSSETGEIKNLYLMGRILSQKTINTVALFNVFNVAWKTRSLFSVVNWNNNTFLFHFKDSEDRDTVLRDGSWFVMNNLLVLKPLKEKNTISKLEFDSCLVSFSQWTSPDGILLDWCFLRVRVEVKITKPLPKGFWFRRAPDSIGDLWISYKYEKLCDFCYACGRLGHDSKSCKFVSREEGLTSGYGPELRTGRARASKNLIEEIWQQVDERQWSTWYGWRSHALRPPSIQQNHPHPEGMRSQSFAPQQEFLPEQSDQGCLGSEGGRIRDVSFVCDVLHQRSRVNWLRMGDSISANGEQMCNVIPHRGLRQGDLLSPYPCLIAVNVLSLMINKVVNNKSLVGIRMR